MSDRSLAGRVFQEVGRLIAPAFLAALLILGGASRGAFYANGALQVISVLVLIWCLFDPRPGKLTLSAWWLLGLLAAVVVAVLLQLVPLPPEIWSHLPGRKVVLDGFEAIGAPLPWLPVSMSPEESLFGLLKFLPPLAAFVLAVRTPWKTLTSYVFWALIVLAAASVMLGLGQVLGGRESPLYFHEFTNWTQPVGFMANVNHQATFLLMTLPFAALLASRLLVRGETGDGDVGQGMLLAAFAIAILLGVAIAGSFAGYALAVPAVITSVLVTRTRSGAFTVSLLLGAALVLGILGVLVASSPVLTGLGMTDLSTTSLSRPDTYARTLRAIGDVMPIGSGLGTFEGLFPSYEDPTQVTSTFMNHAHSDYLEFVLEFGAAGIALIAGVLVWFVVRTIAIWREEGGDSVRVRRAASAALLIVILHSMVDYPLRTAAVGGLAAFCLGLMAARGESRRKTGAKQLATPAQHVTI